MPVARGLARRVSSADPPPTPMDVAVTQAEGVAAVRDAPTEKAAWDVLCSAPRTQAETAAAVVAAQLAVKVTQGLEWIDRKRPVDGATTDRFGRLVVEWLRARWAFTDLLRTDLSPVDRVFLDTVNVFGTLWPENGGQAALDSAHDLLDAAVAGGNLEAIKKECEHFVTTAAQVRCRQEQG